MAKLCRELRAGITNFLNDAVNHGVKVLSVSGVQTMGTWRLW